MLDDELEWLDEELELDDCDDADVPSDDRDESENWSDELDVNEATVELELDELDDWLEYELELLDDVDGIYCFPISTTPIPNRQFSGTLVSMISQWRTP